MTTSTPDLIAHLVDWVPADLRGVLKAEISEAQKEIDDDNYTVENPRAGLTMNGHERAHAELKLARGQLAVVNAAFPALAARLAEVEQDLANERHDIEMVCHEVSLVYDHVTNGFASKPNTMAFEIISLADDHISKLVDEEVKERTEAAESLNTTLSSRLKEAEERVAAVERVVGQLQPGNATLLIRAALKEPSAFIVTKPDMRG